LNGSRTYRIESSLLVLTLLMLPLTLRQYRDASMVELSRRTQGSLLALGVALWALLFLPRLDFPFLSDDYVFLHLYQRWQDLPRPPQFFRPVFAAAFWTLSRLGHGSPVPFHLASLSLHCSSACLVYSLARRFFGNATSATLCFIAVLLNPLQLEASLWSSGLQELLWTFFTLAALRCYIGAERLSAGRLLATTGLLTLALLSKETAVSFVLLVPVADWMFHRFKRGPLLPVAYATFAALLVAYLWLRQHITPMEEGLLVPPTRLFLKQFISTPYRYFAQPWNASVVQPPAVIPCVLALLLIGLLFVRVVVYGASTRPLAGPVIVLLSTLPLYRYFYVGPDLVAARYIYFAAFGWALFCADLLTIIRQRWLLTGTIAMLALAWALSLQLNLEPWLVSAEVIGAMRDGLRRAEPAEVTITRWQKERSEQLDLKNGIPYTYRGVGIFINGYPQFVQLASERPSM
jgi:hypothetical protein